MMSASLVTRAPFTSPFMGDFEPCPAGQNRSSGAILGEKAMRATLEWRGRGPSAPLFIPRKVR